jgi:hypothetical protein
MSEELLARLFEEYDRRRQRGEHPQAEDFREAAGEHFERFEELLREEFRFEQAMAGAGIERLPRRFAGYRLLGYLGHGGYGDVYRAEQLSLKRPVAVKVLREVWEEDSPTARRFREGASVAATIEHVHAVTLHDFGVFEGRGFLVMGLLPGPSLAAVYRRLREAGPPPFGPAHHAVLDEARVGGKGTDPAAFARRLASALAGPTEALQVYHARGLVHRDVKPANLIFGTDGCLVLTDFDLMVDLEGAATERGLGTGRYMSPEQRHSGSGEVCDGRSDLYSIGAVLYEGLTLEYPPQSGADGRAARVLQRAELPSDARKVVVKTLEPMPQDRYTSAGDLAEDLGRLGAGEPVQATAVPRLERGWRWAAKRRWAVLGVGTIVLLAIALWSMRPATLHFAPVPGGEIFVDGEHVGSAPAAVDVPPGEHRIVIRLPGFADHQQTVHVDAGASLALSPTLRARDPLDPRVLNAWKARLGIELEFAIPASDRGTEPAPPLILLFPRGRVRLVDLNAFSVETTRAVSGELVVLAPDGTDVLREPVRIEDRLFARATAAKFLERLQPGSTYRWRVGRSGSGGRFSQFEVVAANDPPGLLALPDPRLRRLLEIGLLQRDGLHVAAFRTAMRLAEDWPRPEVYALAYRSLSELDLTQSASAAEVLRRHDSASRR